MPSMPAHCRRYDLAEMIFAISLHARFGLNISWQGITARAIMLAMTPCHRMIRAYAILLLMSGRRHQLYLLLTISRFRPGALEAGATAKLKMLSFQADFSNTFTHNTPSPFAPAGDSSGERAVMADVLNDIGGMRCRATPLHLRRARVRTKIREHASSESILLFKIAADHTNSGDARHDEADSVSRRDFWPGADGHAAGL